MKYASGFSKSLRKNPENRLKIASSTEMNSAEESVSKRPSSESPPIYNILLTDKSLTPGNTDYKSVCSTWKRADKENKTQLKEIISRLTGVNFAASYKQRNIKFNMCFIVM